MSASYPAYHEEGRGHKKVHNIMTFYNKIGRAAVAYYKSPSCDLPKLTIAFLPTLSVLGPVLVHRPLSLSLSLPPPHAHALSPIREEEGRKGSAERAITILYNWQQSAFCGLRCVV